MGLGKLALAAAAYKVAAEELEAPEASASSSRRPLLPQPSGSTASYGATHSRFHSPEALRRQDSEGEVVLDDETVENLLEEAGLYVGNYRDHALLYAFVPLTCIIFLGLLAPIPLFLHTPTPSSPFPMPELLLGASLWSLSYVLAPPLYQLFSLLPLPTGLSTALSASTHAILRNALRVAALPILELTAPIGGTTYRTLAFAHVWAFALGCAGADAVAGVCQGYSQLALYKGVMVKPNEARRIVAAWLRGRARSKAPSHSYSHQQSISPEHSTQRPHHSRANSTLELEQDLDALVNLKAREDLEELYGVHLISIPVFVTCVLRVASLALLVGFILVMSAAWLSSPYASSIATLHTLPPTQSVAPFWLAFTTVCVAHAALATLHAPPLLRKVGAHVAAYAGLVLGLGALFAGLGMWDVLV
ncbi:hypothetical protein PENSPDRAFT_731495 [Peniophora sp. CONT]|nr:hypothetical protein PENSPDRAFT_731495 [Peniophora sp. CONT]